MHTYFRSLLFILFCFFRLAVESRAQTSAQDRQALIDLYNATGGDNWTSKTNWLSASDVSTWAGVQVANGRVVFLTLSANNLIGPVPASLTTLTNLESLQLSYNQISSLPAAFGSLSKLKTVYLASNQLTDIPATIGTLPLLRSLDISANLLTSLPTGMDQLTLESLHVGANQLSSLPALSNSSGTLKYLNTSGNRLTSLPAAYRSFPILQSLFIADNQLLFDAIEPLVGLYPTFSYGSQADVETFYNKATRTFSVQVAGSANRYQWKKDGLSIAGATNSSWTLTEAEVKTNAVYYCVISSNNATALLLKSKLQRPALSADPGVNPERNYITTNTVLVSGKKQDADLVGLALEEMSQTTTYLDGLGRPIQLVATGASPTKNDLVQVQLYDALGREPRKYLPYTGGTSGGYQSDAVLSKTAGKLRDFYSPTRPSVATDGRVSDVTPFAESIFEVSPLNRVLEQGAPGASWQVAANGAGRTIKVLERTNLDSEVLSWSYTPDGAGFGTCQATGYYAVGELWVNQTTDEHGNQVREYKDKQGQVVSRKVQFQGGATPTDADFLTTGYLYDDLGQLRLVVQPEGVANVTPPFPFTANTAADFLSNWCFTYHYDGRGRLVEKKVPGSEVVYLVYNKRDEVVLTQDGAQRLRKEWSFSKYDALDRPVMNGIYANDQQTSRTDVQDLANSFTGVNLYEQPDGTDPANHGYTNRSFPKLPVGNASGWLPSPGKHSLSVTPYTTADATGTKGATTAISFNVVQSGTYTDNTLPTLTISAPASNSSFNAGSNVVITATASDEDGLAKVEYFQSVAGGFLQKLGEKTATPYSLTWTTPPGGTYLITVKATDTKGGTTTKTVANVTVKGSILREVWTNIAGEIVALGTPFMNNQPTSFSQLSLLEAPMNEDEYYASRIRGYLTPTETGNYTFWIAGDDNCELWLSTSSDPANKTKIADITNKDGKSNSTGSRIWNLFDSQMSQQPRALTAGTSYYIEVVHKEGTQGDNVAVGWCLSARASDAVPPIVVIPGNLLAPFVPNLLPTANAGVDQTIQASSTTLPGSGTDLDGTISSYAWQQRSGPAVATLSGANTANLAVSGLAVGQYVFRLTVTDNSGASDYEEMVLKVEAAPTQSVSSLQLVDADSPGTVLLTLTNNTTIVLNSYLGKRLNIKAVTSPASVGSVQFSLDGTASTSNAAPYLLQKATTGSDYQVYSVNYYDHYDFDRDNVVDAYNGNSPSVQSNKESYRTDFQVEFTAQANEPLPLAFSRVTGKPTGGKVRVLNTAGNVAEPEVWLWSASFYDDRGRVVQTQSDNHLGGLDVSTQQYHFSGRVVRSFLKHTNTTTTLLSLSIKQRSVYDHASRVMELYQQTNGEAEEPISKNSYNELGQLISKKVGTDGTKELQSIDYRYNIRGWLTLINDADLSVSTDLFGMRLLYEDNTSGATQYNQYNGNIGAMQWRSRSDNKPRNFRYLYDKANRLTEAVYANPGPDNGDFSVNGISYDRNGNILTFNQNGLSTRKDNVSKGFEAIDRLRYSYQGNRLSVVEDGITNQGLAGDFQDGNKQVVSPITEYAYDANGNMYEDKNKGIRGIVYNRMNLPGTILMDNGGGNRIEYLYSAAGVKLRKEVYLGGSLTTTTDYVGGLVFENKELQFVPTAEGRALTRKLAGTSGFAYEYHYKDHLGNLRMAFRKQVQPPLMIATMEDLQNTDESAKFANINPTSSAKGANNSAKSALTNASRVLGPWKTIKVSRGDIVKANVMASYTADASSGGVSLFAYLGNSGGNNPNSGGGESGNNLPLLKNIGVGLGFNLPGSNGATIPKAYLRYIFYDEEMNYVGSGFQSVSTAAKGANAWEKLELTDGVIPTIKQVKATDNGYVQILVANESNVDVYFDNLTIQLIKPMIVQENHYSPFGLNLVGIETQGQPDYRFQYGGHEKQPDLGLNYIDFGARMYDAARGQFTGIDPKAELSRRWGTYSYAYDNPIRFTDPDGMMPTDDNPIGFTDPDGMMPTDPPGVDSQNKPPSEYEMRVNPDNAVVGTGKFEAVKLPEVTVSAKAPEKTFGDKVVDVLTANYEGNSDGANQGTGTADAYSLNLNGQEGHVNASISLSLVPSDGVGVHYTYNSYSLVPGRGMSLTFTQYDFVNKTDASVANLNGATNVIGGSVSYLNASYGVSYNPDQSVLYRAYEYGFGIGQVNKVAAGNIITSNANISIGMPTITKQLGYFKFK